MPAQSKVDITSPNICRSQRAESCPGFPPQNAVDNPLGRDDPFFMRPQITPNRTPITCWADRMFRVFVILLLFVTTAAIAAERTALRKMWASHHYSTNSVPEEWRPANIPPTASDVSAFANFSLRTETFQSRHSSRDLGCPAGTWRHRDPTARTFSFTICLPAMLLHSMLQSLPLKPLPRVLSSRQTAHLCD